MSRVFVVGALLPTGGAYMAYHLGRLLHLHFGYELFDVAVYRVEKKLFRYDTPIKTVIAPEMEKMITDEDILIVNPSFSQFLFGLRLPGRKIMYIQDFRTFLLMDCHFDLYVSVSSVVSRYVYALYGVTAPVIPAFIQLSRLPEVTPWQNRPAGSAVVYMKNASQEHQVLLGYLREQLKDRALQVDLSRVVEGRNLPQPEFLKLLGGVRYFVNLSLAEGFGLIPLEAMAMGCTITGLDGLAGSDYMKPGQNALVGSIKNLRPLADIIANAFADETLAERIANNGRMTANLYSYQQFKASWLRQFSEFLQREPVNA